MILPATALRCDGQCAQCAKPSYLSALTWGDALEYVKVLCLVVLLPLVIPAQLVRSAWHRLRFPYSVRALKQAVAAHHADPSRIDSYVQGVLRGYATNAPERIGFSHNHALQTGLNAGGKLRRGELTFAELPQGRVPTSPEWGIATWLLNRVSQS